MVVSSDAFVNMHMSGFCQTKSEGWTDDKTKTIHQHHHFITHSEKSPGSSGRDHFDTNFGTLCVGRLKICFLKVEKRIRMENRTKGK